MILKQIPGFSKYSISRLGSVFNIKTGKRREPFKNCVGRLLQNNLPSNEGKNKSMQVYRLVAITYIPNPNNYPYILHRDDNPENNYYKNLYWGTQEMNCQDKSRNGNAGIFGTDNGMTKYTVEICSNVLKLRGEGKSAKEINTITGIPKRRIYFIFNGSSSLSRVAQKLPLR